MTKVHDRPRVQEHDDAVAETLLKSVFPTTTETPPPTVQPPTGEEAGAPGRHIRWMRWLALGVALLLVGVGAFVLIGRDSGTTSYSAPVRDVGNYRTADGWDRYYSHVQSPTVTRDYRTADGWARYLAATSMGTLDYRTADGWARALQQFEPVMDDQRTADGWVRYFEYLDQARDTFIHL